MTSTTYIKLAKFSIPYFPGLSPTEINEMFIPFLIRNKPVINDVYITCRIPPFTQDAMGTKFTDSDNDILITNALAIQEATGIPVSATFNNIHVSPRYTNYLIFIEKFKPLYERGIRSVTLPFTSWLLWEDLKKAFPDLYIKNTILHDVKEAYEVANLFEAGFEYVNLDRRLMRFEDRLKEIKEVRDIYEIKLNKKLKLSLLYNESCAGTCPIQQDHYTYNVHNNSLSQPDNFFMSDMDRISCSVYENDPSYVLKMSNIPSYLTEISRLSNYVDVFKMHGRENKNVFMNSLSIVEAYKNADIIHDEFKTVFKKYNISNKKIKGWLSIISNCQFKCYKCNVCETLIHGKNDKGGPKWVV